MGELVRLRDLPSEIEFKCPRCKQSCKTFPRTHAVVHAKPECVLWHRVKKDPHLMAHFLINGGVPVSMNENT